MAIYNYTSFGQVKQQLANRLFDAGQTFWNPAELGRYIVESLRTFNALTGYWKGDFVFPSKANQPWYDIASLADAPNTLRPYTVTTNDLYLLIQNQLLEPADSPLTLSSVQISPDDIVSAVQRRRDEILSVTACTVTRRTVPAVAGRIALPDTVIDVRRMAYLYTLPTPSTSTVLASFAFQGANADPIGAPWVPLSLTDPDFGASQRLNNALSPSAITINSDSYYGGVTWPTAQFFICTLGNTVGGLAGGALRMSLTGASTTYGVYLRNDSMWVIDKFDSGVYTVLGSGVLATAPQIGDVVSGDIIDVSGGARIRIFRNGVLLGSLIDSDPLPSGAVGVTLASGTTVDQVQLLNWQGGSGQLQAVSPIGEASVMWPEDTWAEQSFDPTYTLNPAGIPDTYIMSTQPPISFDTNRPPAYSGQYELLTIEAGAALDTAIPPTPQTFPIPDDWTHLIVWGALADLLSRDSNAQDIPRARYCEQRYRMGLTLLDRAPALLAMRVENQPLQIDSIRAADLYSTAWEEATPAFPLVCLYAGMNLVAFTPPPNIGGSPYGLGLYGVGAYGQSSVYPFTATVVRNAPIPIADTDPVQVSREDLDALIDYAQHLASFKMGGQEFADTLALYRRFLKQAALYNSKLLEFAEFTTALYGLASREKDMNPVAQPGAVEAGARADG